MNKETKDELTQKIFRSNTISLFELEVLLDTLKHSLSFTGWTGYTKEVREEIFETMMEKLKSFEFKISKN